jgi:hypothetical protein
LLQNHAIGPVSVVEKIRAFCDASPEFLVAKLVFFCFFGREINAVDTDLDAALHGEFSMARESATKPLHPALVEFFDQPSDDLFDRWIESGYRPGSIAQVLKDDDVNTLGELSFDVNDRIPASVFAHCPIVQHNPTLLQFAAFFGSVDCFRSLLERNADVNAHDEAFPSLSVMQFAIAGGNRAIIDELYRRVVPLRGSLQIAARYYQNELFDALLTKVQSSVNDVDYATMLHHSCAANNLAGLSFCFTNGDDVSARDETGKTPLHYAAIHGSVECGRVLLSQDDIDLNARDRVSLMFLMI